MDEAPLRLSYCHTMTRSLLVLVGVAALACAGGDDARAQGYPRSPISMVIPLAPGDATDVAGRAMADELSRQLKVPVVAVNRPGAGGAVGTDSVVKAAKDGYTIVLANNAALTFRRILEPENVAYDPVKDLVPLGLSSRIPSVIAVAPDAPYRSFAEMVAYAKRNPDKVRVGTVGAGSVGDFAVQLVNSLTGAGLVMVPFKGASPAITALRGGHVEAVAVALGALAGQLKAGAARGVLISTKFPDFPEIPTLVELGYKQNLPGVWFGFFAPAGVPSEVVQVLAPAIERAVREPAIASRLLGLGIVQDYAAPDRLLAEIGEEHRAVEQMARRSGLIK
jgi:tripartite-type tricarboxylate transporter receptor subunit TctC